METNPPLYHITLILGADTYSATGETIFEALSKLKPKVIKTFATFKIEYGGNISEIPIKLFPVNLKRVLVKTVDRELLAKRLQTLL